MIPQMTAQQIADAVIAQLELNFTAQFPLLRGYSRKLAKAIGMSFVTFQQYGAWMLLQLFPKTASFKDVKVGSITVNPLKMWGELLGIYHKTGQRAERMIEIDVITQGGTLYSGTQIVNPDTQMVYQTLGDVALDSDDVTVGIRATRVGIIGNVDNGASLSFMNAPDTVEKDVSVYSATQTGTDPETEDAYRERVMERFIAWPQGGAMADYKLWAEEVEGVRNAYPYSGWVDHGIEEFTSRAGQVFVYIESSADPHGIPGDLLRDEVKDHIEHDDDGLSSRRNINADVYVLAITRRIFDVEITGLAAPDLSAVRSDIEEALSQYFLSLVPGGQAGYTTLLPRRDIVSVQGIGGIAQNVALSHGAAYTGITVREGFSAVNVLYLQEGEKARLGEIVWI
jgi:uncharacterized phage protein gp47/JayE